MASHPHSAPPQPLPHRGLAEWIRWVVIVCSIAALLLTLALIEIRENLLTGSDPVLVAETAAVRNLHAIAAAQTQYRKKTDVFAASGRELNARNALIAADLMVAFEQFQNNGDPLTPQPKAGYLYRMLQSDAAQNPVAWRKDALDSAAGMIHWAVICRAAEPGAVGERQFLIAEDGAIYARAEPAEGTPRHKTFLLDDLSGLTDAQAALDPQKLAAQGWKTAP